ncbi:MAG: molybdopterin-guanine dinucleotide biosynthesis protein B [Alkalispirochaeta sp.]
MVVSVVGYAKSGKTTWVLELIRRAVAAGMQVALIKTGRRHHPRHNASAHLPEALPDSIRARRAGADPAVFWWEEGLNVTTGDEQQDFAVPLPSKDTFGTAWWSQLPPALHSRLMAVDIIVVEGRIVPQATVVHLATTDEPKYVPEDSDIVVRSFEEIPRTTAALVRRITPMPGKHTAPRRGDNRTVTLQVNGKPVDINGYVMDVFQEVAVGLVRSLGTENTDDSITISVGPVEGDGDT